MSFVAEINPQTTEALLGVCSDLVNKRASEIYLMLSTPGGSVMHGFTIYNFLRALPVRLTTHNTGNVDSIGNIIYLAGTQRYACPNTTFMFHGVGFDVTSPMRFEEKFLLERLGSVQSDQARIEAVIVERSTLQPKEVKEMFLQGVTRDPSYAKAHGIVHDIHDVNLPPGGPVIQLVFKR